ncbi:MAG: hypothetical protein MZU97_01365 [Bacillus subtilis]|nr:hypothetical protein [Bacillus subtilis]
MAVVADAGGYNSHAAIILNANQIPFLIIPDTFRHASDGDEALLDFRFGHHRLPRLRTVRSPNPSPSPRRHRRQSRFGEVPACHWRESFHLALSGHQSSQGGQRPASAILRRHRTSTVPSSSCSIRPRFRPRMSNSIPTWRCPMPSAETSFISGCFDIEPRQDLRIREAESLRCRLFGSKRSRAASPIAALLKLSTKRPVAITIPMVQSQDEIDFVQSRMTSVMDELRKIAPDAHFDVRLGAMIETVAMTHVIRKLRHLDFLQVGTNDLLASLLEISRDSTAFSLCDLFFDPLFLRMLRRIAADAKARQIPIAICGEAANQPALGPLLIALDYRMFVPEPLPCGSGVRIARSETDRPNGSRRSRSCWRANRFPRFRRRCASCNSRSSVFPRRQNPRRS